MTDATVVKSEQVKTGVTITETGATFVINFPDGTIRTFDLDKAGPLYADFAIFGARTKIQNSMAMAKGAAFAEKLAALDTCLEALDNGEWSIRGKGEAQPTGGLLAQALANLYGQPLADIQTQLAAYDKATQDGMRLDPTVAAEIARIRPPKKVKVVKDVAAVASALAGFGSLKTGFGSLKKA
jgi:hypothetical protein